MHEPSIRKHIGLVQHHTSKAMGLIEAGHDGSGEMAEAKRNLIAVANEFGMFCDEIDNAAQAAVEGKAVAE